MKHIYIILISGLLLGFSQNATSQQSGTTPADGDGNTYGWVKIGDQYWMSENLRTTKFLNGDEIQDGTSLGNDDWFALLNTDDGTGIPAYSRHTDENYDFSKDGLMYNWFSLKDTRGICPNGWKAPSDEDWKELERFLGVSDEELDLETFRGIDAEVGAKLKSSERDFLGTNETGFSALPSGCRDATGPFNRFNIDIFLWSSTEVPGNINRGYRHVLRNSSSGINRSQAAKSGGYYCRCLKDETTGAGIIKDSDQGKVVQANFYSISGVFIGSNIKNLPAGIYIKHIEYESGKYETEKIIKTSDR